MLQPAVIPSVQIRLVLRLIERTITILIWEAALKDLGKSQNLYHVCSSPDVPNSPARVGGEFGIEGGACIGVGARSGFAMKHFNSVVLSDQR